MLQWRQANTAAGLSRVRVLVESIPAPRIDVNKTDFERLTEERVNDARALLAAGRWPAAYYLAGYAVECALKACIAKLINAGDFDTVPVFL